MYDDKNLEILNLNYIIYNNIFLYIKCIKKLLILILVKL